MNSDGEIKEFDSEGKAKSEGFETLLSAREAKILKGFPKNERHKQLACLRKQKTVKKSEKRKRRAQKKRQLKRGK